MKHQYNNYQEFIVSVGGLFVLFFAFEVIRKDKLRQILVIILL